MIDHDTNVPMPQGSKRLATKKRVRIADVLTSHAFASASKQLPLPDLKLKEVRRIAHAISASCIVHFEKQDRVGFRLRRHKVVHVCLCFDTACMPIFKQFREDLGASSERLITWSSSSSFSRSFWFFATYLSFSYAMKEMIWMI